MNALPSALGSTCPTVREAVIALLREHRMTALFGNPGSTELPLTLDFPPDFRYLLGLQESVVLGMADGYRVIINNGAAAGQTVFHLHLHVLGGRRYSEQHLGR